MEDPLTLSTPIIDGVDHHNFSIVQSYANGTYARGVFEWGLVYKEQRVPVNERSQRIRHSAPYASATHSGHIFAIKRSWFKELGWYDPGLEVWGGEHFELSFKVWQCGGRQVRVPCSRVAHVHRDHSCSACHSIAEEWNGVPFTLRNYRRIVETWFDPIYKEYFYTREPLARFVAMGDISKQVAFKQRKHCKSFTWFMSRDLFQRHPAPAPNAHWGELRNQATNLCVDTLNVAPAQRIGSSGCHSLGGNQLWRLSTDGHLASGEWCAEYKPAVDGLEENELSLEECAHASGNWELNEASGLIFNKQRLQCLVINQFTLKFNLGDCDSTNIFHRWIFMKIRPYWAQI